MVYPGFQMQDLAGPLAAFEFSGLHTGHKPYRLQVVSPTGGSVTCSAGLPVVTTRARGSFDTFIVMGGNVFDPAQDLPALAHAFMGSARGARRIASVCTGAFILAAAGLLEGRCATTHWMYASQLQRQYPGIKVQGNRIFTKDGQVWTSAGITAGIDLALAMIEEDLGTEVSRATARSLVVYHRRPGGQSQFSALLDLEPASDRIREVLTYMREHLGETLPVERLAAVASLSPRQFSRIFVATTGETPAKAVERLRVEAARSRVEHGTEPIEAIARQVGFSDPERMRRAFVRLLGHPPQSIRRMAGAAAAAGRPFA